MKFATETTSPAPADALFARLEAGDRWSEWAGPLVPRSRWEVPGDPVGSVGAVRRLGIGPLSSLERIVEHVPGRRLVYVVDSWSPVHGYRAEVDLVPIEEGGTRILWSGSFTPKMPGTGPFFRWALKGIVSGFARNLARS